VCGTLVEDTMEGMKLNTMVIEQEDQLLLIVRRGVDNEGASPACSL